MLLTQVRISTLNKMVVAGGELDKLDICDLMVVAGGEMYKLEICSLNLISVQKYESAIGSQSQSF